nr:sterile alpha motif-like domain-containing protein [Methanosarcina sp. KYL-1]
MKEVRRRWKPVKITVYKDWIKKFENESSPIGDLARDIIHDKNFPKSKSKSYILRYLYNKPACKDAIDTFTKSWDLYRKENCGEGGADMPLSQALEFIKKWNPETGTVCDLEGPYTSAYMKTRNLCKKENTPENEALLRKVVKYRKHIPNQGVADLNRRLYREGNILRANRIIASDHQGYCLLHRAIDEDGRPKNTLFQIYTLKEVERRLDNRRKAE